jgi:hypothetical protein
MTSSKKEAKKIARPIISARATLVAAAIEGATTPAERRALRGKRQLAVVVQVPTPAWVGAVGAHFTEAVGQSWNAFARDGSNRTVHTAETGNADAAKALAGGQRVVGIAANLAILPTALMSAVDITIRIANPSAAVLREAIMRFTGGTLRQPIGDDIGSGLDFDDLTAAMRDGSSPERIVERLRAASAARRGQVRKDRVPVLETAVEYGDARLWGLDLARDIADYRAGKLAWRDVDRGVCLHSAPGLGKSLFAHVLARACDIPLVSASIGELFASSSGNLDGVIKAMRSFFSRAAALAPCILFVDEIDAMPNRETLSNHNRDWWTPVINDFLTLLDAAIAGQREGVVVVGATNNIQAIDPALLRPGRLEKMVEIKRPDLAGAINILRHHLDGELKGDLSEIGAMIEGSTGAEIMYAVRGARRIARHAGRAMTADDIKRSIVPIAELPPDLIFRMSIHEAAHAVVALAIPAGTVRQVVIRSKGGSGGRTTLSFDGADLFTRRDIEDQVVVDLAARVAERHFTGAVSCGGGGADDSDLGVATVLIASLHASFAMGDQLVYLAAGDELLREVRMNPALHACVDQHLRGLEGRAEKLVRDNRDAILAVARRLSVQRYLSGAAVREIVEAASASNGPRHRDISDASSEG